MTPCRYCDAVATFAIYSVGYPCPMFRACADHLGPLLAMDASHPGSTMRWEVVSGAEVSREFRDVPSGSVGPEGAAS